MNALHEGHVQKCWHAFTGICSRLAEPQLGQVIVASVITSSEYSGRPSCASYHLDVNMRFEMRPDEGPWRGVQPECRALVRVAPWAVRVGRAVPGRHIEGVGRRALRAENCWSCM